MLMLLKLVGKCCGSEASHRTKKLFFLGSYKKLLETHPFTVADSGHLHVLCHSLAPSDYIAHLFWPISDLNVCCLQLLASDISTQGIEQFFSYGKVQEIIFRGTKRHLMIIRDMHQLDKREIPQWGKKVYKSLLYYFHVYGYKRILL